MKFNDILDICQKNMPEKTREESLKIYTYSFFNIIKNTKLKDIYTDLFICNEEEKKFKNKIYSSKIHYSKHSNFFDRDDITKSNFTINKTLTEEDNNFLKLFKENLQKSENLEQLSSYYSFDDITRLNLILNFEDDILSTLVQKTTFDNDYSTNYYKHKKISKNNFMENSYHSNNYSNISNVLDSSIKLNIDGTFNITPENISKYIEEPALKMIMNMAGFNLIDFSIEDLEEFIDDDFIKNNPIGVIFNSKNMGELHFNLFNLLFFEQFKIDYLKRIDEQLLNPTFEYNLNNDKELQKIVNLNTMEVLNKYPELNLELNETKIMSYSDLEKEDIYNVKFLIEPFNMFNLKDLESFSGYDSLSYFDFSPKNFVTSFNNPCDEEYYKEEPIFILNGNGITTNVILGITKTEYKSDEINEYFLNSFIHKNNYEKEHIVSSLETLFDLARQESFFINIKNSLFENELFSKIFEEVRLKYTDVLSVSTNKKYSYSNGLIKDDSFSYKENIEIQKAMLKKTDELDLSSLREIDIDIELMEVKKTFSLDKKNSLKI